MANEYRVNAADLSAVADAIRAKAGSSASLPFPKGFVSEIGKISTGSKPKLIRMTTNCASLDSVAWGGKTYREIFLAGNKITTGNAITDTTTTGWVQYSGAYMPTATTEHYNTSPSSWNCCNNSRQMYKDFSLPTGNDFYIACKRKLISYTSGKWLGVEVYFNNGNTKVISDTVDASFVSGTFQTVSHTFTPTTATTRIWVGCGGSAKLTGYVDDIVCINMTELFGSDIPTRSKLDEMYETFLSLYSRSSIVEEFTAYGTFADENGNIIACSIPVNSGESYYIPFDGNSAVVVFEYNPNVAYDWAMLYVDLQGDEIAGYTLCGGGEVAAYCMYVDGSGNSDVYDVTITLLGEYSSGL